MILRLLCSAIISLFAASLISAQGIGLPLDVEPSKGYQVGPGDELVGKVVNEDEFGFTTTVNEDGMIEVPFHDKPIPAVCRTERELKAEIITLLSKYLRNPQLQLRVTEKRSRPPATIYGEVRTPQQIVLTRKATLVELLAFSGGVTEEAGGMIQVFRTRPPICSDKTEESNWKSDSELKGVVPSKLYSLANVRLGKEEANPIILPGDVVVVQKAAPVYITGEVLAPQGIFLKEGGTSLYEAIAKIGGPKATAKTKDIRIYRLKAGASPESRDRTVISANYDEIRKGKQNDIMLEPYDVVEVDKAKESIAMQIMKIAIGAGQQVITATSSGLGYRVIY